MNRIILLTLPLLVTVGCSNDIETPPKPETSAASSLNSPTRTPADAQREVENFLAAFPK